MNARCVYWSGLDVYSVEFSFGGQDSLWYGNCSFSNESVSVQQAQETSNISGFEGSVLCPPDAAKFCFYNRILGGLEIVNSTFAPPTTTTTTLPQTTTTTEDFGSIFVTRSGVSSSFSNSGFCVTIFIFIISCFII